MTNAMLDKLCEHVVATIAKLKKLKRYYRDMWIQAQRENACRKPRSIFKLGSVLSAEQCEWRLRDAIAAQGKSNLLVPE